MIFKRDGLPVSTYTSEYIGKKIVIGIDSSKSNTGIVIGDACGNVYHDYEIDGSGSENEVFNVSYETRKMLRCLLKDCEILKIGIEDIITKKYYDDFADGRKVKYNEGLTIHKSRAVITHIYDSFIIFFMDEFGITPTLVNNQAWKTAILPEEFRKRHHKKGAKDYYDMYYPASRWANRKDDVTDAYCIYQYLLKYNKFDVSYQLNLAGKYEGNYEWGYYPISIIKNLPSNSKKFDFKDNVTFEQLRNMLAGSMTKYEDYVYMIIPIDKVPIKEIYDGNLMQAFPKFSEELVLVITGKDEE